MSLGTWLVGVDDTDMPGTRGTGFLSRMLAEHLVSMGGVSRGITRHQLLVHPEIRYTSHNSANCLELGSEEAGEALFAAACEFVSAHAHEGSDPGVCVAGRGQVAEEVRRFGARAQSEVLAAQAAMGLAERHALLLAGLAGTRGGVIGALAAVGLRAGGNDGRFIALGGIRELDGAVAVRQILDAGVSAVRPTDGGPLGPGDRVQTFGWLRPRLLGGLPVVLVERSSDDGVDWVVRDRRVGHSKGGPRPED